jgi:hypothetical protein
MEATPDGTRLVVVTHGRVLASEDGGCSFEAVSDGERWWASDVTRLEGTFFVLARRVEAAGLGGGAVLQVTQGGLEPIWEPADGTAADDVAAGAGALWVARARPEPRLMRGDPSAEGWRFAPVAGLPPTSVRRLSVRAVTSTTLFAAATVDEGVRFWRVPLLPGPVVEGSASYERAFGPVHVGDDWYALVDGRLARYDGARFIDVGSSSWTCLHPLGEAAYACSLDGLFALGQGADGLESELVFSFAQLGPPAPACPPGDEAAQRCENDWLHFGSERGWVGTEPATSPGGSRSPAPERVDGGLAADGGGAATSATGCVASPGFRRDHGLRDRAGGPTAVLVLSIGVARRRRARTARGRRGRASRDSPGGDGPRGPRGYASGWRSR